MSNYTQSTNFATKDALSSGDPLKIVKGTEINTEFVNISTAIATKADLASPTFTGNVTGTFVGNVTGNVTGNVSGTAANVTGTVAVANGGTGATSFTSGALLKGAGTGAVAVASAADIVGQIGSTAVANATTAANGGVTSVNGSTGAVTVSIVPSGLDVVGSILVCVRAVTISVGQNTLGTVGETIAGSSLRYGYSLGEASSDIDASKYIGSGLTYDGGGTALSGTWRCIGRDRRRDIDGNGYWSAGLWQRIS
jgi:hypothetical protein